MPINALEDAVNHISDTDSSWWPFLWLRPEKDAPLSLRRQVALAGLYGLPTTAAMAIIFSLAVPAARATIASMASGVLVCFLFVTTIVVGPMWNRRAARLSRRR